MYLSKTIFRFLLVIMSFLALVTGLLFVLQEPGTDEYVVTVITLLIQLAFIAVLVAALYFDWNPFEPLEGEI